MSESRPVSLGPWVFGIGGILILIDQVAAILPQLYPFRPETPVWRYQALLLPAGRATPIIFGALLLAVAAALSGSRGWLRTLGILGVVLAVGLVFAIGAFLLDAIEIRRALPEADKAQFAFNSARVAAMFGLETLFAAWLGVKLIRSAGGRQPRAREEGPTLVVGARREAGSA